MKAPDKPEIQKPYPKKTSVPRKEIRRAVLAALSKETKDDPQDYPPKT